MRTYNYTHRREDAAPEKAVEEAVAALENPFTRAAYEWNNALRLAASKMWGDHPPMEGS